MVVNFKTTPKEDFQRRKNWLSIPLPPQKACLLSSSSSSFLTKMPPSKAHQTTNELLHKKEIQSRIDSSVPLSKPVDHIPPSHLIMIDKWCLIRSPTPPFLPASSVLVQQLPLVNYFIHHNCFMLLRCIQ